MNTWSKKSIVGILALVIPTIAIAQVDTFYVPTDRIITDAITQPAVETDPRILDYPTLIFPDTFVTTNTDLTGTTTPTDTAIPTPEPDPFYDPYFPVEPDPALVDPYQPEPTPEPDPSNNGTFVPPETERPEPEPAPTDSTPPRDPYYPPAVTNRPPSNNNTPFRPTDPLPEPTEEELNCPPFDPLAREPVECPTKEPVPIIPIPPYLLFLTPALAALLFWGIMSYFNRSQRRIEDQFSQKHIQANHQQNVNKSKVASYRELLDLLTTSQSAGTKPDQNKLQNLLSKVELLGSNEMKDLGIQARTALGNNDTKGLKPILKDMAKQIRLEN
jgi:hypothetical protein